MNDHDLENLLASLAPARPSAALEHRVNRELEQDLRWALRPERHSPRWLPPMLWTTLGAAAAVVVMSLTQVVQEPVGLASVPSTSAVPSVLPVSTIREVVDTQDQGIRYNETSRLPEQHMKIVSLERRAWIDPRDGAHITVEVPREDSVVLPVSFQ
jgi:hypothetical protein